MNRIERFQAAMPAGMDAAVITSEANRQYFLGFAASNGTLLITRQEAFFFTDSRYVTAAKQVITGAQVLLEQGSPTQNLKQFLQAKDYQKIAFEAAHTSVQQYHVLKEAFGAYELDFSGAIDTLILHTLRRKKSADEVEKIKAAQAITDACFRHMCAFIKEGMSEKQIQLELDFYLLSHGADALSFETIVAAGENGAKPHAVPSEKRVKRGEFITMDFGAVVDFYHSDMTRTIALGEPDAEMVRIYNTVLFAQNSAIAAAKSGVSCKEVDRVARQVIADAGYGAYFGHGTGHGVGVEIHEQPCFNPTSEDVFSAGDVVTVEPGIYVPGKCGVRIEDMLYLDAQTTQNLTKSEKKLIVI